MKMRFTFPVLLFAILFSITAAAPGFCSEKAKAQELVDQAVVTLKNFKADPDLTWFRNNAKNARALLIVPKLYKGGFIFGGSGGNGVLISRDEKTNLWTYPVFYGMGTGSVGFQIGFEKAQIILAVMTQKGIDALLSTEFKLGGNVSVSAGPVGAGATAQTADVLAFSRSKGLFAGVSLEGSVIKQLSSYNADYYGKPVSAVDILVRQEASNAQAQPLLDEVKK